MWRLNSTGFVRLGPMSLTADTIKVMVLQVSGSSPPGLKYVYEVWFVVVVLLESGESIV